MLKVPECRGISRARGKRFGDDRKKTVIGAAQSMTSAKSDAEGHESKPHNVTAHRKCAIQVSLPASYKKAWTHHR
jgi:hypothetical protein